MKRKRKITYTLFVDDRDDNGSIERKLTARLIRSIAVRKGENMADWARELGVTRQYISQVVSGRRRPAEIRAFIERRLGQTFWQKTQRKAS